MVKFPNWAEVNVPEYVVKSVRTLSPGHHLDALIHHYVYGFRRSQNYTYYCNYCDHEFKPSRQSEEIAGCPRCNKTFVRVESKLRWSREVPNYSRWSRKTEMLPQDIIYCMTNNYVNYFSTLTDFSFDCGWVGKYVYCKFAGGDEYRDTNPRYCVMKAALLCPYLWDLPEEHFCSVIANNWMYR